MTSVSSDPTKPNWVGLINESVHTSDDIDIGDIDAISRDFIVVKRGYIRIHYYYIPINRVEGWDGFVLWLKITEEEVKRNCERDIIPDPYRYYVKDYPYYTTAYYPELIILPPRYQRPDYTTTNSGTSQSFSESPSGIYKCDLCGNTSSFKTEDELSSHVAAHHK